MTNCFNQDFLPFYFYYFCDQFLTVCTNMIQTVAKIAEHHNILI